MGAKRRGFWKRREERCCAAESSSIKVGVTIKTPSMSAWRTFPVTKEETNIEKQALSRLSDTSKYCISLDW